MLHWSLLQRIFGSALGTPLGRISFVLYLIHVPIIGSLAAWMVLTLPSSIAVSLRQQQPFSQFCSLNHNIPLYGLATDSVVSVGRQLFASLFGDRSADQTV
jgi:hypothetical protein